MTHEKLDLHLFNSCSLNQLAGLEFSCSCAKEHAVSTKSISFGSSILDNLDAVLQNFLPSLSSVLVLTDSVVRDKTARMLEKAVARFKYRISLHEFKEQPFGSVDECEAIEMVEDCKGVIGIGGPQVLELAKYLGARYSLPMGAILTSYDTIRVLSPSALLFRDGIEETFKVESPQFLFCDTDFLCSNNDKELAGAFGSLASKVVSLFDYNAAKIITKEPFCSCIKNIGNSLIDTLIKTFDASDNDNDFKIKLAESGLRFGVLMQLVGSTRLMAGGESQAGHVAKILFKHEERDLLYRGEYEMILSRIVLSIYQRFLGQNQQFFTPPPDNNMRLEQIEEFLGLTQSVSIKKLRIIPETKKLDLQSYRLGEYRADLFSAVSLDLARLDRAYSVFKRLYDDDGFNLKNALDESSTALAVALGADLKDKFTLLSHLKDLGLLDEYVKELL